MLIQESLIAHQANILDAEHGLDNCRNENALSLYTPLALSLKKMRTKDEIDAAYSYNYKALADEQ